MNLFIAMLISFLSCWTMGFCAELEIKIDQKSIKVPYWVASGEPYGGVVLVNGGDPAQWSDTLTHIAELLSKNGWSTVLLNSNPEISVPWLKQVPEAISAVRKDKNKRIVLIHYGEQLNMTLDYFSKPQGKGINGLILLSATDDKPTTVKPTSFRFPIFDIDGQFDYDEVKRQLSERSTVFKSPNYLSLEIPGADHEYSYAADILVSFMSGWMLKIPESTVSAPPINPKSLVQSYLVPIYLPESHLVAINDLLINSNRNK
jgi:hypothetical protein